MLPKLNHFKYSKLNIKQSCITAKQLHKHLERTKWWNFKVSLTFLAEKWSTACKRCAAAFLDSGNRKMCGKWKRTKKRKKIRQEIQRTCCCSSSRALSVCLLDAAERPSPLCRCKITGSCCCIIQNPRFFFLCSCLCGWLQALSLFYGHMHVQGITARIFKETGAVSRLSAAHDSCWSAEIFRRRSIYIYYHASGLKMKWFDLICFFYIYIHMTHFFPWIVSHNDSLINKANKTKTF